MKRHRWTGTDDEVLRALYPEYSATECAAAIGCSVQAVVAHAKQLGLRKSRDWIAARARERSTHPGHGGRATQFAPGLTPWNKGRSFVAGGRSAETRFRRGRAPSEGCLRRLATAHGPLVPQMEPPPVIVFECEGRIAR